MKKHPDTGAPIPDSACVDEFRQELCEKRAAETKECVWVRSPQSKAVEVSGGRKVAGKDGGAQFDVKNRFFRYADAECTKEKTLMFEFPDPLDACPDNAATPDCCLPQFSPMFGQLFQAMECMESHIEISVYTKDGCRDKAIVGSANPSFEKFRQLVVENKCVPMGPEESCFFPRVEYYMMEAPYPAENLPPCAQEGWTGAAAPAPGPAADSAADFATPKIALSRAPGGEERGPEWLSSRAAARQHETNVRLRIRGTFPLAEAIQVRSGGGETRGREDP